ncbi:hypothetical protein PUNSTDRAFT_139128 [Punctularia strigosozonata HHB-11173 SS5]|uniref:F-box domain-containing protein n=1 Tax=Punctularia strigosozonata (strain HHB-11173) TaxID=741275 RepID=R7S214_PUNST|nr:uncharacterized protein PUNSTDRAFT_139128 [Punctularia strigosozonata HHB-11173 SS5]EIN03822.1 hypothetical protein PUNSTDRAFT_139128 [Punctularia strigosozonata HHB-11173 SS5]
MNSANELLTLAFHKIVWLIFSIAVGSSREEALTISLVCKAARKLAIPFVFSTFRRWPPRKIARWPAALFDVAVFPNVARSDEKKSLFALVHNICLCDAQTDTSLFKLVLNWCRNISNLCVSEYALDSLVRWKGHALPNLDISLRQLPYVQSIYSPSSRYRTYPVANAVTHLRLPGIPFNVGSRVPRFLSFFANVTHVSFMVEAHSDDILVRAVVPARVNSIQYWISKATLPSLQMVVIILPYYRGTPLWDWCTHYPRPVLVEVYQHAIRTDPRFYLVPVKYDSDWNRTANDIHDSWEAECIRSSVEKLSNPTHGPASGRRSFHNFGPFLQSQGNVDTSSASMPTSLTAITHVVFISSNREQRAFLRYVRAGPVPYALRHADRLVVVDAGFDQLCKDWEAEAWGAESVWDEAVPRIIVPEASSLAKTRPKPLASSQSTPRTSRKHDRVPNEQRLNRGELKTARHLRRLPIELVWHILDLLACISKQDALAVSLVCHEARRYAFPRALSVLTWPHARSSSSFSWSPERVPAFLSNARHVCIPDAYSSSYVHTTLFTLFPHLSSIYTCEYLFRSPMLWNHIVPPPHAGRPSPLLSVTLQDRPISFGDGTHRSPLARHVERLRLPVLWFTPVVATDMPVFLRCFPALGYLALPVVPTLDGSARDANVEQRVRAVVRWVRRAGVPSLRMIVLVLHRKAWIALNSGMKLHSRKMFERLCEFAMALDERVHLVVVDTACDELRKEWEAEAWGAESIWDKAARTRRGLMRQAAENNVKRLP